MSEFGFYSFSEPLGPGIDFSTPDEAISISSSIVVESNLVVNTIAQRLATASLSIESNATTVVGFIIEAQVSISIDGATLTLGTGIKSAQSIISISSDLSINITKQALAQSLINPASETTVSIVKQALAQSEISSSSSVSTLMTKTAKAFVVINALSNVEIIARRIRFISASLNGNVNLSIAGKVVLATIRINIINNSNITAESIRFSNSITADSTLIRSLLMLDGVPLTNENRRFDIQANPIYIENSNWQGDSSRYYKNTSSGAGAKRVFSLQWSFIPNYENRTVDLGASRNYINRKSRDGDVHVLTIIKQDEDGTTPYTEENIDVLITDYTEDLIRRDLVNDVYYFNCAMSLQEV
jgi:hypothetical protein